MTFVAGPFLVWAAAVMLRVALFSRKCVPDRHSVHWHLGSVPVSAEAGMKCFLSYSSAYGDLKEPIRRLLEAVGFDAPVDVFDGPDQDAVPEVVIQKIKNADAVVVLYGPRERPRKGHKTPEPADWPREEVVLARGMHKPIAMIVHEDTRLPESLAGYATPARFDFWDRDSFLQNVHHVVRHLLEFRERLGQLGGTAAFKFRRSVISRRLLSRDQLRLEAYHEVVARHACSIFEHTIDTDDQSAVLPCSDALEYVLEKRSGPEAAQLSLRFGRCTAHQIEYFIEVTPDLEPGQELGYWRSFLLPNRYPLTRAEIAERATHPGFPNWLPENMYAESWDIAYDIESITHRMYFPREFPLASYGLRVEHYFTREENVLESERCKPSLTLVDDPEEPHVVLEFNLNYPRINHSYIFMYEPAV